MWRLRTLRSVPVFRNLGFGWRQSFDSDLDLLVAVPSLRGEGDRDGGSDFRRGRRGGTMVLQRRWTTGYSDRVSGGYGPDDGTKAVVCGRTDLRWWSSVRMAGLWFRYGEDGLLAWVVAWFGISVAPTHGGLHLGCKDRAGALGGGERTARQCCGWLYAVGGPVLGGGALVVLVLGSGLESWAWAGWWGPHEWSGPDAFGPGLMEWVGGILGPAALGYITVGPAVAETGLSFGPAVAKICRFGPGPGWFWSEAWVWVVGFGPEPGFGLMMLTV